MIIEKNYNYMRIRYIIHLLLIFPLLSCGQLEAEVSSMVDYNKKLVLNNGYCNKVKDFDESVYNPGYQYLAFFCGAIFQGNEIHVARVGNGHLWCGNKGVLVFNVIGKDRIIKPMYPSIDYNAVDGELRDPNITVSRDGNYLYLSSFSCDQISKLRQSWFYILDKEFKVVGASLLSSDYCVWGNTLETEDHYLLKTAYSNDKLFVLRSKEKVTDTRSISFEIVHTFEYPNLIITEGSMAYVNKKLVLIMRTSQSSYFVQTNDLEGEYGWGQWYSLGKTIHSPALIPYQDSKECLFMGGVVINNSCRQPCFGKIEMDSGELNFFEIIDSNVKGFGGYPSFVDCGNGVFSTMYYDDYANAKTAVYYQRF